MNKLMLRKRCYGFSNRGVVAILARVLQLLQSWRQAAALGPADRQRRQVGRQQLRQGCQVDREKQVGPSGNPRRPLCQDVHDMPTRRVELLNLPIGKFGHLLNKGEKEPHLAEYWSFQTRAFHHLAYLSQSGPDWTKDAAVIKDIFGQEVRVKEFRRVRSIDLTKVCRARARPIDDGCPFEEVILWASHRAAMGTNIEKSLLCLTALQVEVRKARDKLLKISKACTACNKRRALCNRQDNLIKLGEKGPSDLALKPFLFSQSRSTHVIDVLGPLRLASSFEGSQEVKIFALIIVELPLKLVRLLPLRSYSTEHFLIAMETNRNQYLQSLEVIWSDQGSNFKRAQNKSTLGEQDGVNDEEEEENRKALSKDL